MANVSDAGGGSYDLSTYEGRQAARDAGNWVGTDSSGNIVMESSAPSGTMSGGGGGGAGGGTPTAADGQTLSGQSWETQQSYQAIYGGNAAQQWVADHNAAIGAPAASGATSPSTTSTSSSAGTPGLPTQTLTNTGEAQTSIDNAMKQAYQVYLNAKLALDTDELAFHKAQQAFSESLSRAQMTGTWEGKPTFEAQQVAANLLGTFQGQPTLAAQKQLADMLGIYQGQTTLGAQQQYWSQAFQQAQANQKAVQDYLQLLSGLRGPQDYGQYLRVMASTPQGLQGLVNTAAGQQAAAFGTTGVTPTPVTLGGFMGAAGGAAGPGTPNTSYDQYMQAARGLPPPSQIAPQNWNAMTDTQRQLLLSMYEQAGWNVNDALQQYKASLPKFGSTSPQAGTFQLV